MSLTNKFNKLTIEPETQMPEQNTDINMEVAGTPAPSQKKMAGQKPSTEVYDTELLEFVKEYYESAREKERLRVLSLDDEYLFDRMLAMGKDHIDRQIGQGLVGVMKGPDRILSDLDDPTVYLEMYYKHGEWALREGYSSFIKEAMEDLERKMGEDAWNELSREEQMDAVLEQSEEDVQEQRGWGVVTTISGMQHYNELHRGG
ncbi:hypothetical protein PILCRDRAFT_8798 [Piloderma croceum F 1598]|uniref:Uncharacterized protein n=1 Tax=Piloderma croceum (strain F 1598) TaxID=765440 RepID=A0A0C3F9V5_PILCF|nr:hypothetical protein PILCRDRAFT_8798 [Piloderma croceum F 1598]